MLLTVWSCSPPDSKDNTGTVDLDKQKLLLHAKSLKQYAAQREACCGYGILIDMSKPSWENRFFVVDFSNDSVIIAGLCAHGRGSSYMQEDVQFSNVVNSYCTSEGRYEIGQKYNGSFGLAYKLHGLDATNNNAFKRFVVFHSHSCVSDFEGEATCRSDGCPTVSPMVLKQTAKLLDASDKPMLMWIYK